MISTAALLAWSALALALTLTPGPDTMLVAGHSVRGGARAGLGAVAGIACGGFVYAALFGFGLLKLISATPTIFLVVKTVGAVYLAWLGAQMLWRAFSSPASGGGGERSVPKGASPSTTSARGCAFRQGFLTNALNPKIAIFYLAALPQFASGPNAPAIGVLLIAIHYAMGAAWLSGVALAAARAGALVRDNPITRWIEGAVGVFFLAVAGRLAVEQR